MSIDLRKAYSNKKILITGGLGFLGSNLAHRLVELGAEVSILDALLPQYGGNMFNVEGIKEDIEVVIGDIRDQEIVTQLVKDKDYIFNFAAQVSYIDSADQPFEDLDINCRGHLVVLEACRHHNPNVKLLFSSSRMALGRIIYNPVKEDHPAEPLSIYGVHKLTAEKYYLVYNKTYGLKTVILRITNPYGERQQMKHSKYSIVGWFLRQAMEDKTIKIFGTGEQLRDYIYVQDIVEAFLRAGASEYSVGEIFNIGSGESTKFVDMVKTVIKVVKKGRIEFIPWPDNYEKIETGNFMTDLSKTSKILEWKPKVGLEEGIKRTFEYYKKYKDMYW